MNFPTKTTKQQAYKSESKLHNHHVVHKIIRRKYENAIMELKVEVNLQELKATTIGPENEKQA